MTGLLPLNSRSSTILNYKIEIFSNVIVIALLSSVTEVYGAWDNSTKHVAHMGERHFLEAVIQTLLNRACCSSPGLSSVPTAGIEEGSIHCPSCCSLEAKSRELSFLSSSSFL